MSTPATPSPGWYPNPEVATQQRYWDGSAWTEHVAPFDPAAVQQPGGVANAGPGDAMHWLVPVGRSGSSIAAGYLGLGCFLFGLIGMFGFIGTVLAFAFATLTIVVSRRALKKSKEGGNGGGRAIFGFVGAGVAILGGIIGLVMTFLAVA